MSSSTYTKNSSSTYQRLKNFATKPPQRTRPPRPPKEPKEEILTLVRKFRKASEDITFRNREGVYHTAVNRLASGKHFSCIESILERQKKYTDSMSDEAFVARLITLYGKVGMFDHARTVFDELPQYRCSISVCSFNALLYACVQCNKVDELGEAFREVPKKLGVKPNVVSCGIVLEGLCAANDFDSAMNLMDEMEENDIEADIVCYNIMLEGYYRVNRLEEAVRLRQRMEAEGVIADERTYNAILKNFIRNGQSREAFEFVENMVSGEVKPDTITYNLVINECVRRENLEEGKILHSKMVEVDCLPDVKALGMLIWFACDKGDDVHYALELTKQAFELPVYIERPLMQLVVDALMDRSMIEEANDLVAFVYANRDYQYRIFL